MFIRYLRRIMPQKMALLSYSILCKRKHLQNQRERYLRSELRYDFWVMKATPTLLHKDHSQDKHRRNAMHLSVKIKWR